LKRYLTSSTIKCREINVYIYISVQYLSLTVRTR